jgi:hypothetical protein
MTATPELSKVVSALLDAHARDATVTSKVSSATKRKQHERQLRNITQRHRRTKRMRKRNTSESLDEASKAFLRSAIWNHQKERTIMIAKESELKRELEQTQSLLSFMDDGIRHFQMSLENLER